MTEQEKIAEAIKRAAETGDCSRIQTRRGWEIVLVGAFDDRDYPWLAVWRTPAGTLDTSTITDSGRFYQDSESDDDIVLKPVTRDRYIIWFSGQDEMRWFEEGSAADLPVRLEALTKAGCAILSSAFVTLTEGQFADLKGKEKP